jgi:hypothetical protein
MIKPLLAGVLALTLAAPTFASPAQSSPVALAQNQHITDSLVAAQVGDMIRKTCPTISPRYFVLWQKANDLESYARAQGYQESEVTAFLKDKTEKARIRGLALDYLTQAGAQSGDADSYCQVGRAEIAKGSLVGQLLRSSE